MAQSSTITLNGGHVDMSSRIVASTTVVGSPALAAETTVATVSIPSNVTLGLGVLLFGFVAFTVGTSGVSATVQIRRTNTGGTAIVTSGATTVVAANLIARDVLGLDTGPTLPGQVYVLDLTIGSGGAVSTVSSVALIAFAV